MKRQIDLLSGGIFKPLTELALPIMATALVQTAYSLTDMAWIGIVGSQAVAAVGAASMYTWLSQGVVALAKMGGQIKVAHSLGAGKPEEAAKFAQGALQLGILFALAYAVTAVLGAGPLIGFFKLSDATTILEARVYLRITCGFIIFSYLNAIITGILTAMGDSRTPFLANVIGLLTNMALDPALIFGIGPIPEMGVMGAAVATVTAQLVVSIVFFAVILKDRMVFDKVRLWARTPGAYLKTIFRLGLPAAVQNLIYTSISMVLTRFVAAFGDAAVAVQRVGSQIESISWMTADGFAAAINSFIGQNYGAGQIHRVKRGYLTAIGIMFVWGLFCTSLLVFLPGPIFSLFIHESDVIPMGISYLVILGYSQMFMCVELTTVGALSGLGKTLLCSCLSVVFTSARIPLAVVLSNSPLKLDGIWWAYAISSIVKGILFFICFLEVMKRLPQERKGSFI